MRIVIQLDANETLTDEVRQLLIDNNPRVEVWDDLKWIDDLFEVDCTARMMRADVITVINEHCDKNMIAQPANAKVYAQLRRAFNTLPAKIKGVRYVRGIRPKRSDESVIG